MHPVLHTRPGFLNSPSDMRLIVQHDAQQRAVDFHGAVVLDEAQFPKLVHKLAHSGPRGADHLRERLLTNLRDNRLRFSFLAKIGQ